MARSPCQLMLLPDSFNRCRACFRVLKSRLGVWGWQGLLPLVALSDLWGRRRVWCRVDQ